MGSALWENAGELWTKVIGPRSAPSLQRLSVGEGFMPRLEMNPGGRGIALWQAEVGGQRQILGRILGGGESMAQVIFRTEGRIQHLQAAVDRRGNPLVVWLLERQGQVEVMAQSFDTRGLSWENEPTTLGIPSAPLAAPRIAVNHRGHAMVLWEAEDATFAGLVASHYWPQDRIWSDRAVPVVSQATRQHQVVMDDMGNALALWVHPPPGLPSLLEASFYDVRESTWSEPVRLGRGEGFSTPRLVMSGDGQALAAWFQGDDPGACRLYARPFAKGAWGAPVEFPGLGPGPVLDFDIGLGDAGEAGLIAVQDGFEGQRVWVRLRQGEWGEPMPLGVDARRPCSSPRLSFCPLGASALWLQGEGEARSLLLSETR
jgi:hypothetical protein